MSRFTAKRVEWNGIKFRSQSELRLYKALRAADVRFEHEKRYNLTPETKAKNFKYPLLRDHGARQVTMDVDFVIETPMRDWLIDVKGSKATNEAKSKIKYDILKHQLDPVRSAIVFIYYKDLEAIEKILYYGGSGMFFDHLERMRRY